MKECGISNIVYLIEESAAEAAPAFGWEGIYTAITQIQVESNFFLKRTWTAQDSADYLAALTRFIQTSLQVTSYQFYIRFFLTRVMLRQQL